VPQRWACRNSTSRRGRKSPSEVHVVLVQQTRPRPLHANGDQPHQIARRRSRPDRQSGCRPRPVPAASSCGDGRGRFRRTSLFAVTAFCGRDWVSAKSRMSTSALSCSARSPDRGLSSLRFGPGVRALEDHRTGARCGVQAGLRLFSTDAHESPNRSDFCKLAARGPNEKGVGHENISYIDSYAMPSAEEESEKARR